MITYRPINGLFSTIKPPSGIGHDPNSTPHFPRVTSPPNGFGILDRHSPSKCCVQFRNSNRKLVAPAERVPGSEPTIRVACHESLDRLGTGESPQLRLRFGGLPSRSRSRLSAFAPLGVVLRRDSLRLVLVNLCLCIKFPLLACPAVAPKERRLVPRGGLEPPWDFSRCPLKTVCLPISPSRPTIS